MPQPTGTSSPAAVALADDATGVASAAARRTPSRAISVSGLRVTAVVTWNGWRHAPAAPGSVPAALSWSSTRRAARAIDPLGDEHVGVVLAGGAAGDPVDLAAGGLDDVAPVRRQRQGLA